MIGAVSLKLADLEKRQKDHQTSLTELKLKLDRHDLCREELDTKTLKSMLFQFQADIKEHNFKHNDLKSKVNHLTVSFEELQNEMHNLKLAPRKAPSDDDWKYDPEAPEFTPRKSATSLTQAGQPRLSPSVSLRLHKSLTNISTKNNHESFHPDTSDHRATTELPLSKQPVKAGAITPDQLSTKSKDALFKDLLIRYEDQMERERAWINKEKWYSQKLRLLRQDKRRRGDTIGKLLKSIDEISNYGRHHNNITKSQAGKPLLQSNEILAKVHKTRNLPGELRIEAVIEIAEAEKNSPSKSNLIEPEYCWGGHACYRGGRGAPSEQLHPSASASGAPCGRIKNDNNNSQLDNFHSNNFNPNRRKWSIHDTSDDYETEIPLSGDYMNIYTQRNIRKNLTQNGTDKFSKLKK